MAPLTKDRIEAARQMKDALASPAAPAGRPTGHTLPNEALHLEIPVRIQGSRAVAVLRGATEHTEGFDEQTSTLVVFPQGAVVKLAARVTPGQLLAVTNRKTSHGVLCRVLKARTSANAPGYVEVEFTRSTPGFWGVSFPSETPLPSRERVARSGAGEPLREQPVEPTPSPYAASAINLETMPVAASLSAAEPLEAMPASEAAKPAMELATLPAMADAGPREQAFGAMSSDFARTSVAEAIAPVAGPASDSFGRYGRSAALPRASSPFEVLETRLDQPGIPGPAVRERQPRRLVLFVALSFAVLALAVGAGFALLRHSESVAVTEVPARSLAEPHAGNRIDAARSVEEPASSANPASQSGTSSQPTTSAAEGAEEGIEPAGESLRPRMDFEKLRFRAAKSQRVAARTEEPPPVLLGELPGGMPGGASGSGMGGIVPEASRASSAPAPPLSPVVETPLRVGGRVREPRLLYSVKPVYPALARRLGIAGDVALQIDIDATGKVIRTEVLAGPPILRQAAVDAVRQRKYEAARLNDQPVTIQMQVTVKFRLQ